MKTKHRFMLMGLLLVAVVLGCSSPGGGSSSKVKFEVTGSAPSADIKYTNDSIDLWESLTGVSLPWSYTFSASDGEYVWLWASAVGGGSVTVTIYNPDGSVFMTNSGLTTEVEGDMSF